MFKILFFLPISLFAFNNLDEIFFPPSLNHFLGTDYLGRDIFLRILQAIRNSLLASFACSFLSIIFGIIYVFMARFSFYIFFINFLNIFLALPSLLFVMIFQSNFESDVFGMILVIALTHWAYVAKTIDSKLNYLEKMEFYECALVLGSSKIKAFFKELMPACFGVLSILFVINIIHFIYSESLLSFFGIGFSLNTPSLGNLLNEANNAFSYGAWWAVLFPVFAILFIILILFYLNSKLQDYFGEKI